MINERPGPVAFGPPAPRQRNDLTFDLVVLADEQRAFDESDLLVGKQSHRRPANIQAIPPRLRPDGGRALENFRPVPSRFVAQIFA